MNKRGFSPILIIIVFVIVIFASFVVYKKLATPSTGKLTSITEVVPNASEQPASTDLTDVTCNNLHITFKVPAHYEKYEETNVKGEQVCFLSDKIQDGHISPSRVYISAFATQNTSNAMGMTSRQAAEADTKKYGGMTDLPEAVVKKGKLATFHVIAPDALNNTAVWYVHSISNDDTDTYYTITLSVPTKFQNTINTTQVMNGYVVDESF